MTPNGPPLVHGSGDVVETSYGPLHRQPIQLYHGDAARDNFVLMGSGGI